MRFLLVAPVLGLPQASQPAPAPDHDPIRMRSTDSSRLLDLEQAWTPLPIDSLPGRGNGSSAAIVDAQLVSAPLGRALVGLVDVAGSDQRSKAELDELLTDAASAVLETARSAIGATGGMGRLAWVQRTLITTDAALARRWTARAGTVHDVRLDGYDDALDADALVLGWGDNALIGSMPSLRSEDVLLAGLVDAQLLWTSAVELEQATSTATRPLLAGDPGRHGRKAFSAAQSVLEEVAKDALRLHLAVDDWRSNAQGLRRRVAEGLLESWEFDRLVARLDMRSDMVATLMANRKARLDRRYQTVIQAVLAIVGAVALLDLALSLVATALTNVDGLVGEWEFGLLSLVRLAGADAVVTVGLALFILAGAMAYRANRGAQHA